MSAAPLVSSGCSRTLDLPRCLLRSRRCRQIGVGDWPAKDRSRPARRRCRCRRLANTTLTATTIRYPNARQPAALRQRAGALRPVRRLFRLFLDPTRLSCALLRARRHDAVKRRRSPRSTSRWANLGLQPGMTLLDRLLGRHHDARGGKYDVNVVGLTPEQKPGQPRQQLVANSENLRSKRALLAGWV